ncbi:MAG: hypothetical protein AMXMBFR59_20590 [Rhodanobacteraceae bacterium]
MVNVIEFLERVGRDSRLRHASPVDLLAALDPMVAPELKDVLLNSDAAALERLLGARTNVICGMAPAEDDAPEKDKDDDEEIRSVSRARAA